MLFSEITGHDKVKKVLARNALSGKTSHAYIFEGPKGVGKFSVAKAFAGLLMCESPTEDGFCGRCESCSKTLSENHPDIRIITNQLYDSQKKSSDVLVDTIRNMKQEIYIKPYISERKVYIIPKADTMNMYAQNSLLKVLEEPPSYCIIILLAENTGSFLPTILSRAQIVRFFPLETEEVLKNLEKSHSDKEHKKLELAAKMSKGSIEKANAFLEDEEALTQREELLGYVFGLYKGRKRSIYDLTLFLKQNKDDFEFLTEIIESVFCDLLYLKNGQDNLEIKNSDVLSKLRSISEGIGTKTPVLLLETLQKYSDYFSKNISYSLLAECLSLELWEVINDRGYRSKV